MIQVICGSRDKNGQTAQAVDAVCRGITSAGGKLEVVYLPELTIERCRQCDHDGWGICRDGSGCVIDDDLQPLVDKIKLAEGVVFATPVYFSDLSESLRAFLDRFRRFVHKGGGMEGVTGKPALLLCVAGGGGGGAPQCVVQMEKITRTIGFDILDTVPARKQNLKNKIEGFEQTGRWFCESSS